MAEPKISFFLGAGASVFMTIPATKQLMESFLVKHQSCAIGPMVRNYQNKNIEDLYADVNQLLDLHRNMVLPHIPIICATNEIIESIEDFEGDEDNYLIPQQCDEHPLLASSESESHFEPVYDMLELLKHSLGKHVFESLKHDEKRLSEYGAILKRLRRVAGSYTTDIITTNYDLLIEGCCDNLGLHIIDGFSKMPSGRGKWQGFANNDDGDIKLLKLHGSLNWHKDQDETPIRESTKIQYDSAYNIWIEPSPQKVGTEVEPFKSIRTEFQNILRGCNLLIVVGFAFNDDIWKNTIGEEIKKEGNNKMRLLYISRDINNFISGYGSELIINEYGNVDYKSKTRSSKKQRQKYYVDYFLTEFNAEHIDDIIKVIEHAKQYTHVCI